MPTYVITAPDGKEYEIDAPEGATEDQALAYFQQNWKPNAESDFIKKELTSPLRKAAGVGEAGLQIVTSLPAATAGGLRGLFGLATGDTAEEAARKVQETQQMMTYDPRLEEGKTVARVAALPMELASKGTGYVGGKVGQVLGNEAAGQTIGEITPAVVSTLYGGAQALKSGVKTPKIPGAESIRDIIRTRSKVGQQKLAEDYLRGLTTPDDAPKVVAALERRGTEMVPGSPVTSADAIARANREMMLKGQPERFGGQYVALQEGLGKVPETTAGIRTTQLQQEAARAKVLTQGAGTDAARAALEATRRANAAKNYQALADSTATVEIGKTVNLIDRIVKAKPANKALVNAMEDVKSSLYTVDDAGVPKLRTNPGELQSAIENINNLLSTKENASVRRQLMVAKSSLENQINKVEKAQGQATKQYALDSLPLNQMDLWSALKDKFVSPSGKEAPGSYLRALRDETKLIKQATGFKRGHSLEQIFNKDQSKLAARLAAEMEMELVKKRMAGEVNIPGLGKAAEGIEPRLPNMLMRETMVANFILKTLAKNANVDVNIAAANILKDPKALAGVLKQVKVDHRPTVLQTIRKSATSPAGVATGTALMETEQ